MESYNCGVYYYYYFNPNPRLCFLLFFFFLETKGAEGAERERERETDLLPPVGALTCDPTSNLGVCPDQELNPRHFGAQDDAPTN